jgi:prepilin-type N-terminal cleavage/methylation domain-containing protein
MIFLKLLCHAGLSSIFLQKGFRPSRNDSQCGFPPKHQSKLNGSCKGFTLLELIVALFLISLITAVVLPSFAGFGERKLKSEAREMASILRFVHDSAVSRKETYWVKFDLDGNVVVWKGPEGEKTKKFDDMTSITTLSTGTVSRGEVTIFIEPLGLRENISVHMGAGDENMKITFNHLSGKVKIKNEG